MLSHALLEGCGAVTDRCPPGFFVPGSLLPRGKFNVGLGQEALELVFVLALWSSSGSSCGDKFPVEHDPGESGGVHS